MQFRKKKTHLSGVSRQLVSTSRHLIIPKVPLWVMSVLWLSRDIEGGSYRAFLCVSPPDQINDNAI